MVRLQGRRAHRDPIQYLNGLFVEHQQKARADVLIASANDDPLYLPEYEKPDKLVETFADGDLEKRQILSRK